MALGQQAAADLWKAAESGVFKLTEAAARECAGHYEAFAHEMDLRGQDLYKVQRLGGFGSLGSAQKLQQGFEGKAHQAYDAFKTAEQSALRMAAAIYKAAGMLSEVDTTNAAALRAADKEMPDAQP
ncbi:hypothetical protein [Nocardia nova]|uniref:hypothetical protein n=1 Tax=Nocardia nova TaxID=37330 RepID=UPI00340F798C